MSEDSTVLRTRSLGVAAEGIKDQYADGIAAKVWENFIGDRKQRTTNYKNFIINLLKAKGCKRILDVACGTGVDSIMLIEEGYEVVSIDASDKMLKYALQERWTRRKEPAFDKWIVQEANWLTLTDDIASLLGDGFDAVVCLGNSFAHLLDSFGDQREQKQALENFKKCVKPGGFLLIDHRNYDEMIRSGKTSPYNIYYNSPHLKSITVSVMFTEGVPNLAVFDYLIKCDNKKNPVQSNFRLSYYPYKLDNFRHLLTDIFGSESKQSIFADFQPLEDVEIPGFYIHLVETKKV